MLSFDVQGHNILIEISLLQSCQCDHGTCSEVIGMKHCSSTATLSIKRRARNFSVAVVSEAFSFPTTHSRLKWKDDDKEVDLGDDLFSDTKHIFARHTEGYCVHF